jgi:hypothetical protein
MPTKMLAGCVAVVALTIAGCGTNSDGTTNSSDDGGATTQVASHLKKKKKPTKVTPLSCLRDAGLDSVQPRGKTTWRGTNPEDGTVVLVERVSSPAEAKQDAKMATQVWAFARGRYFIHGPFKSANDGMYARITAACTERIK